MAKNIKKSKKAAKKTARKAKKAAKKAVKKAKKVAKKAKKATKKAAKKGRRRRKSPTRKLIGRVSHQTPHFLRRGSFSGTAKNEAVDGPATPIHICVPGTRTSQQGRYFLPMIRACAMSGGAMQAPAESSRYTEHVR